MRVSEIFHSIQGEATNMGRPTVFVRTQGCSAACDYCDTEYSWNAKGGVELNVGDIAKQAAEISNRAPHLCITGGEPLEQTLETEGLVIAANSWGFKVEIETNGLHEIYPHWLCTWIVDIKCPSSGISGKTLWHNMALLKIKDSVMCVIKDRHDFDYAIDFLDRWPTAADVFFNAEWKSGAQDVQLLEQISEWIKKQGKYRMGVQLHKYIWGEKRGV